MPIGLLTTSYPRHPHDLAGSFVAGLAHWLADAGEEVEVLAPSPAADHFPGISVRPLRYALRPRLFYGAGAPDNLSQAAAWPQVPTFVGRMAIETRRRAGRWGAVISHWLLPCGVVGALASRGLPHLAVAHSSDVRWLARRSWLAAPALELLARPRTALVLTSESLRSPLMRVARGRRASELVARARVIRMGIDGASFSRGRPEAREALRRDHGLESRRVVLYLGRLVPVKGVQHLIEACAGLPEVTLVVAGDGPERRSLEARAAELSVPALFLGEQLGAAKSSWLDAADLMVLPSVVLRGGRTESAPLVLLEAMAAELPVVATRVGGNAELIIDGKNGLLVPPADPAALRHAISRLASSAELRRSLGQVGLETARSYTWDRVGPLLRELLNDL